MKDSVREPPTQHWYAHSEGANQTWEPIRDHLTNVANSAAAFALRFGASDEAYNAGLIHDLGKYGDLFQLRLRGRAHGIDHWSAGAWKAVNTRVGAAVAMVVQGHHIGLQRGDRGALKSLGVNCIKPHPPNLRLSQSGDDALDTMLSRFDADGLKLREVGKSLMDDYPHAAAAMLDVRMLFSALVDADFLATERHFDGNVRLEAPLLNHATLLERLRRYLEVRLVESKASPALNRLRQRLRDQCQAAAERPPGVFTLTAPTGSGKTLAMLEFALRHAQKNGLRRVVAVAPYLSIIDQTADVYREAMQIAEGDDATLLEHHSLAIDDSQTDDARRAHERLAENWDAPLVLTTSVQILESLFSNRPSVCRKLHRLADSVILFDEVQTFPLPLIAATLATLLRLAQRYRVSVVFATATQPAFKELSDIVARYSQGGWQPTEINADAPAMFNAVRRVAYRWPSEDEKLSWPEVARRMCDGSAQALCIVNTKKQAASLYDAVCKIAPASLHLSTAMCPAHRRTVIQDVTQRLESGQSCTLVATQCVEAGVDLDFPRVFRALGPLDSIAQAAGRCNRNQRSAMGEVEIFQPADEQWPRDDAYKSAARLAWRMRHGDLHIPATFAEYYAELYQVQSLDQLRSELYEALCAYDFVGVAKEYRLIKDGSVNVLTSYDKGPELARTVRNASLSADWVRNARSFSINVPLYQVRQAPEIFEPVRLADGSDAPDWYILSSENYDLRKGFQLPSERTGFVSV
jgi:CRISPR-associated helicase Cas3/CRISPR-associated endonuclease Cas3-HD